MVLQTTPPQPSSNAFAMTFALVPGGPEPSTNGFSNFIPSTVISSLATAPSYGSCSTMSP